MKEKDLSMWEGGCAPREKLLAYGASALSDKELLAIFLKPAGRVYTCWNLLRKY